MRADEQVFLKSDRPGRLLILTFCLAPMIVPAFAIGLKYGLSETDWSLAALPMPFASSAQASVSAVIEDGVDVQARPFTLGSLPAREQFQSPIFAAPSDVTQFFENAGTSLVAQTRTSVTAFVPSGTHVLRQVEAREGLRLSSDAMVIKLDGVEPLAQDAECRRLDGVVEPCAQRAQNRLDVLTRGRPVICDMQPDETGDMRGHCRAGKIDLAEDLLRNGLALRRGE